VNAAAKHRQFASLYGEIYPVCSRWDCASCDNAKGDRAGASSFGLIILLPGPKKLSFPPKQLTSPRRERGEVQYGCIMCIPFQAWVWEYTQKLFNKIKKDVACQGNIAIPQEPPPIPRCASFKMVLRSGMLF
jgi:hypothetical protein